MPSRRTFLRTVGAAGCAALAGCGSFGDGKVDGRWPRDGYDARLTGYASEKTGPGGALAPTWRTEFERCQSTPAPVLADDRLCIGYGPSLDDHEPSRVGVRVLDAATGAVTTDVHVTAAPERAPTTVYLRDSVVVAGGALYLVAYDGVYSVTLDGERRWHVPLDGTSRATDGLAGHPVVDGDTVYAPTASITDGAAVAPGLWAIDDATGEVRWRYEAPPVLERCWVFPPAYVDGVVYLSLFDYGVVALDAGTGETLWENSLRVDGAPTVAGGSVFVPGSVEDGERSFVAALDGETGDVRWRRDGPADWDGRELAVANDRVYYREGVRAFVCRDAATGAERWRRGTARPTTEQPVVTADALYVGGRFDRSNDGGVAVLDPATGDEQGFYRFDSDVVWRTSLAVSDGVLFANTTPGRLYAFESCTFDVAGHCID